MMLAPTRDLFDAAPPDTGCERLTEGAGVLRGFALGKAIALLAAVERVAAAAPFRHLVTPGGFRMSVAMTNCGTVGWVSDRIGYRYHVSVSLGLAATFLFGGGSRKDRQQRIPLRHGDVAVWGGPARLYYHGVLALKEGYHAALGSQRLNLTFRRTTFVA